MAAREGNNEAFNKLKLFAQVCRYDLGNMFSHNAKTLIPVSSHDLRINYLLFFLGLITAPYLSDQSLDSSLLSQRSPSTASSSSQTSSFSSTSSGLQSTNTTSSSTSSAQVNSSPSSSSGSQIIGGMASSKPSSYSPFGTAGLQGSTSQNGLQSNPQGAAGMAENGPSANQTQGPTETPER